MRDMDRIAAQISREGALFRERLQTGEAFAAFAERRKPDFSKVAGEPKYTWGLHLHLRLAIQIRDHAIEFFVQRFADRVQFRPI